MLVVGYSGTPLAKPAIKAGTALLPVDAPTGYRDLLVPVPGVSAVDATWSGLKLIVRRGQRQTARSSS